ncbi:MAG: transglutaminase family protein [Acidobacteriota bacterium]
MKKGTWIVLTALLCVTAAAAASKPPIVGESEACYRLAAENGEVRGLAYDEVSPKAPRLFVLDGAGKIFVYKPSDGPKAAAGELTLLDVLPLPARDGKPEIESPRGLAFTLDNGSEVFYVLNWIGTAGAKKSQLWRFSPGGKPVSADLSRYSYNIGERELLSLGYDNGKILVGFDGSSFKDRNLRVQRGAVRLSWPRESGQPVFVKHMPDAGTEPSSGFAYMALDGLLYLWGTVGNEAIYCAEAETGRGLFHFGRPRSSGAGLPASGLAFGGDSLWVPEGAPGPDRVHRVNVTKNLDAPYEGPHILRHLIMSISTEPEKEGVAGGKVMHNYSRPYGYLQLGRQDVEAGTETFSDTSGAANAKARMLTMDPAGDTSSRQYMAQIEYAEAPARRYTSRYEIDIWMAPGRNFVYPHRVNKDVRALKGTDYLADDPDLYDLSDRKTYEEFLDRVRKHIQRKYGVPADMDNAYWAARNVVEYIQDTYYYPSPAKRISAAVDYDRHHYDANPGNLKIELSNRPYDKTQIIACSGTSVMVAGAMRFIGIPARWLGTGTPQGPGAWDANRNGLLDENETAPCSNGHRYDQIWLGSHYGWTCFDATPTVPDDLDFDPVPPLQPQWRYMNRAAGGHLKDDRIVFNVGSTLIRELYRDFEYDEELAVINNCGGDQRYNLQGRFEKPELWKLAEQDIEVKNVCFITDVCLTGPKDNAVLTWKLKGAWEKDPGATVSVSLHAVDAKTGALERTALLAEKLIPSSGRAVIDLSSFGGREYRLLVRKDGDPATGGASAAIKIEALR